MFYTKLVLQVAAQPVKLITTLIVKSPEIILFDEDYKKL